MQIMPSVLALPVAPAQRPVSGSMEKPSPARTVSNAMLNTTVVATSIATLITRVWPRDAVIAAHATKTTPHRWPESINVFCGYVDHIIDSSA
jgi:hypothetical protein